MRTGEHGCYDKRLMLDEAIRVPFIVRYPAVLKPRRATFLARSVDVAPTLTCCATSHVTVTSIFPRDIANQLTSTFSIDIGRRIQIMCARDILRRVHVNIFD